MLPSDAARVRFADSGLIVPGSAQGSRRAFLQTACAGALTAGGLWPHLASAATPAPAVQEPGDRPQQEAGVQVANPRRRVPLSFIIDDSCCLVNLAYFAIPQFAEVFPDNYLQDWRKLPREIPDSFVREFGEWCHEHGVKGKYSIVPNPALVGWVDRELPGWSRRQLTDSLNLVRELMQPDWDIHPEMITHTWAIDTRTGRPFETRTADFMENWGWSVGKSADELTDYLAYALRILKNAGLSCDGVTTPGGFGNRSLEALSSATLQACRDVYGTEIPHYFRHLFTDDRSVAPRVENARGLDTDHPECVVSIIGCTGDWFGGWDGLTPGSVDKFITADLQGGRLPEVIDRGEPAILVCHWPGIYYNGERRGFQIFQEVVRRVHQRNDMLQWMKLSEIARYWAAKELTAWHWSDGRESGRLQLHAPFACPQFTLEISGRFGKRPPVLIHQGTTAALQPVASDKQLAAGRYVQDDTQTVVCFDLPRGTSQLDLHSAT